MTVRDSRQGAWATLPDGPLETIFLLVSKIGYSSRRDRGWGPRAACRRLDSAERATAALTPTAALTLFLSSSRATLRLICKHWMAVFDANQDLCFLFAPSPCGDKDASARDAAALTRVARLPFVCSRLYIQETVLQVAPCLGHLTALSLDGERPAGQYEQYDAGAALAALRLDTLACASSLRSLSIDAEYLQPASCAQLSALPGLNYLSLRSFEEQVPAQLWPAVARLQRLQHLAIDVLTPLRGVSPIPAAAWEHLRSCSSLTHLAFEDPWLYDADADDRGERLFARRTQPPAAIATSPFAAPSRSAQLSQQSCMQELCQDGRGLLPVVEPRCCGCPALPDTPLFPAAAAQAGWTSSLASPRSPRCAPCASAAPRPRSATCGATPTSPPSTWRARTAARCRCRRSSTCRRCSACP